MDSCETPTNPYEVEEDSDVKIEKLCDTRDLSYHDIATKLLNDNLLLTALELHAELVEAGKELPKLRVFFSNPGNFEQHTVAKPDICSPSIRECLLLIAHRSLCCSILVDPLIYKCVSFHSSTFP